MSNRLYPNWQQLEKQHNPLTDGEKALIKYLDTYLPKDPNWDKEPNIENLADYKGWLIFVQPFLNGLRPDIIIFNPEVGVVIYEVKDWNLDNYEWNKDCFFFIGENGVYYPKKSPIDQVEYYKKRIIEILVPDIGEEVDLNEKKYGLIKTLVYFHNSKTDISRRKFNKQIKKYKYLPVFGFDYLKEEKIKEIVPDINLRSKYWNKKWNREVLYWLKPPRHSIEQGEALKLSRKQQEVAEPKKGHYRIRGVVGSGKTLVLAYRAAKLASQGYNVLILTFNITLFHYIKDMVNRVPLSFEQDKITYSYFHGFCLDKLNEFEYEIKFPKKKYKNPNDYEMELEEFFKTTIPNAVIEASQGKNYQKYDAILIDEGQDFHYEWYALLNDFFLTERDELVIVCDKRQNIYRRNLEWLDKRITKKVLKNLVLILI